MTNAPSPPKIEELREIIMEQAGVIYSEALDQLCDLAALAAPEDAARGGE